MSAFDWIDDQLEELSATGLRRTPVVCEPLPGGRCRRNGVELLNLASNDYLGLASHPLVLDASIDAVRRYGSGARASALVSGRTPLHAELDQALAEFERAEAAVLFPTGYGANVGVLGALVEAGDVVYCDRLNHASLIDGCRLSGARLRVYSHTDLAALERELTRSSSSLSDRPRRSLICTDSVFSMDGDLAPLAELHTLAQRFGAMLIVDEAHGTGVFGSTGRGVYEGLPSHENLLCVGTLSKALGSQGGFVSGPAAVCDWIRNRARTQMFSTGLTPAACGAALAALKLIDHEPQRREHVRSVACQFRQRLRAMGQSPTGDEACPIVPLLIGAPEVAVQWSQAMLKAGYLIPAIRPPTVPQGTSRLRISLTADHSVADLEGVLAVLSHGF